MPLAPIPIPQRPSGATRSHQSLYPDWQKERSFSWEVSEG